MNYRDCLSKFFEGKVAKYHSNVRVLPKTRYIVTSTKGICLSGFFEGKVHGQVPQGIKFTELFRWNVAIAKNPRNAEVLSETRHSFNWIVPQDL